MSQAPLLMIPGPIEVSPAVLNAFQTPPPGHQASDFIEAFGRSLERMRQVWLAGDSSQPFVVAGGGTVAMEMAAANLLEAGDRAVLVNSGYFSDRMAEMLRRQGVVVTEIGAAIGEAPSVEEVEAVFESHPEGSFKALFATHVDTSTGVRIDPEPLARLAHQRGALSVFDGVCATAAERFKMAEWDADVYLTASQKAIGLPPGLALLVVSQSALETRAKRKSLPPPMYLDWEQWLPIMTAYEEGRPSYFSTPATNLVSALAVGLGEILQGGMEETFQRHARTAEALRAAWRVLGLHPVPAQSEQIANTLSALYFPDDLGNELLSKIKDRGVAVASGFFGQIKGRYFRVGHMGYATTQESMLRRTVEAVAGGLEDCRMPVETERALGAFEASYRGH